jgi:hypothetical protein
MTQGSPQVRSAPSPAKWVAARPQSAPAESWSHAEAFGVQRPFPHGDVRPLLAGAEPVVTYTTEIVRDDAQPVRAERGRTHHAVMPA